MEEEPDSSLQQQLDFFLKLGYSADEVQAVRRTLGGTVDTDKFLAELVKVSRQQGAVTMSVLVPKGDNQVPGPVLQLPVPTQFPQTTEDQDLLRPVVIDGSNVAMSHGNKEVFSCLGIQLAVNFFLERGHSKITVFVPSWRKEQPRPDVPITDQHILRDLERRKLLVFTPSRRVAGKRVVCNDDWYIVQLGYDSDGVIVSNDMYRDLQGDRPEWRRFIEERLLMYSFVNDKFMPPDDPLGRHGPTLENFLRKVPKTQKKHPCPYGKKCTYGIRCKFDHPERAQQPNRLLADVLREKPKQATPPLRQSPPSPKQAPPSPKQAPPTQKQAPARSSPVPGQSFLQLEDMAEVLSLGPESGSSKKDHKPERANHHGNKRASSRKKKSGVCVQHPASDQGSARHGGSQDQLDSGLGSIDSQLTEAWNQPGLQQQVYPQRPRGPCICCSQGSQGSPVAFQNQVLVPVSSYGSDMAAYSRFTYSGAAYSRVYGHRQHPPPLSDPFGTHPPVWDPPPRPVPPSSEERLVVRKKLLAIYSAQLVDAAMDRCPELLDPQLLVAEILVLQSQNRIR